MYREESEKQQNLEDFYMPFGGHPVEENREFCKDNNICITGKPLGRPRKETEKTKKN